MFRNSYRLPFKLAGIPLYLHISFLFIFPLMIWATARNITYLVHQPQLGLDLNPAAFTGWIPGILGLVAVVGLFVSVVLHELGHSITARWYGVKVRRITLWFLGGVAEFEEMPRQRGAEAVVGIAGPIVSFALAILFMGATILIPRTIPTVWIVSYYLALVNLMLGLFNLLPALPMDGGRILRSLLALKLPHARATVIAGNVSKVLAVIMGIYGLITLSAWTLVLAFFIWSAVRSETEQTLLVDGLRGLGVSDLMTRQVQTVPAGMTVGELMQHIMISHHQSFPVVDDQGRLIGTIGIEQIRYTHPMNPAWRVMSTVVQTIPQNASALGAFSQMSQSGAERLVVLDEQGQIAGIISRADLLRAIQVRMAQQTVEESQPQPPTSDGKPSYVQVRRVPGPFTTYPPSAPMT
jgi:Zn-dependent protease/predicted transcriptional regulator